MARFTSHFESSDARYGAPFKRLSKGSKMTTFVNVGAYSDNARVQSKKALKELVKSNPELLRFDQTSPLARNSFNYTITLDELLANPSYELSVVGPDPFENRKWYANIKVVAGQIKVS